ncbi:type II toxin-antitoxin system RelE/ParE family toxin [Desulfotignum phosphitoxidans]|uniref:Plasmid stabilization system protein n=1 Tax=Desulfotignum phosphitoxidans DSM 13687 TaxID=1286635 RepID=S0G350_9BACT|nr:type II toxin-antitoxin system RelE/ParE family toxin [Desulfotignum phosphitoxidans]EMS78171.1 plasmid stabilization system protein [Desulfotignum phosphitoxidans DSM 13687]
MPRLIITDGPVQGLERCRRFLAEKNPGASKRASEMIGYYLAILESEPEIGRPLGDMPELRELIIPFGESGYVALYRYEKVREILYILAFRHQKEAGY